MLLTWFFPCGTALFPNNGIGRYCDTVFITFSLAFAEILVQLPWSHVMFSVLYIKFH